MAGVSATSNFDLECPVCHEDYTQPKILPCNHRVCRHCVLSWLRKGGRQAGCPLCRDPILPQARSGQGDLDSLVDAMPTDRAIVAHVKSHKILTSRHICTVCEKNVPAKSFCFQCDSKLCKACAKGHRKLPLLKNHVIEKLHKLTLQRLAEINRSTCKKHDDKLVKLYCSAHQELICSDCFPTNHRSCPEVKAIADMAKEKRTELKQQAQRLKQKETALAEQIKAAKHKFKVMRSNVSDVFEDLHYCVEMRRQEINRQITTEEEAAIASLTQLDKERAVLTSHAGTVEQLVTSAPDEALLEMLNDLTSRLNDLELQTGTKDRIATVCDVTFVSDKLTQLKFAIAELGQEGKRTRATTTTPQRTATTPILIGATLAMLRRVWDRVRLRLNRYAHREGPDIVMGLAGVYPSGMILLTMVSILVIRFPYRFAILICVCGFVTLLIRVFT